MEKIIINMEHLGDRYLVERLDEEATDLGYKATLIYEGEEIENLELNKDWSITFNNDYKIIEIECEADTGFTAEEILEITNKLRENF